MSSLLIVDKFLRLVVVLTVSLANYMQKTSYKFNKKALSPPKNTLFS